MKALFDFFAGTARDAFYCATEQYPQMMRSSPRLHDQPGDPRKISRHMNKDPTPKESRREEKRRINVFGNTRVAIVVTRVSQSDCALL